MRIEKLVHRVINRDTGCLHFHHGFHVSAPHQASGQSVGEGVYEWRHHRKELGQSDDIRFAVLRIICIPMELTSYTLVLGRIFQFEDLCLSRNLACRSRLLHFSCFFLLRLADEVSIHLLHITHLHIVFLPLTTSKN